MITLRDTNKKNMYDPPLDAEELELLRSVENDEWQPIPQMEQAIQRYQQIAAAAVRESEITIRLPLAPSKPVTSNQ